MTLKEYRQIWQPTLEELEQVETEFIFPRDAAIFLRCEPHSLNVRARSDIESFGQIVTFSFPAYLKGSRLYIPREPFIQHIKNLLGVAGELPRSVVESAPRSVPNRSVPNTNNRKEKVISYDDAILFRTPVKVNEIMLMANGSEFPVCPRCKVTLDREYQRYCDRCGQHLSWKAYSKARIVNVNDMLRSRA